MRVASWQAGAAVNRAAGLLLLILIALNGAVRYHLQLEDALDPELAGSELWVRGEVAGLPREFDDHVRFRFEPSPHQASIAGLPRAMEVRWYQDFRALKPGEAVRLKLRLRPPRGLVNFQGFDRERALFANGIGALGTVLEADPATSTPVDRPGTHGLRQTVRKRIQEILPAGHGRALVLSLAIADRSELQGEDWDLLRATGTGHLLAISGLHIGLAAVAGFWLFRGLALLLPGRQGHGRGGFLVACGGGFVIAAAYGALAGFPVSTMRALAMLATGLLVLSLRRGVGAMSAWSLAMVAVIALDPFAPLTPGFWLSFGAVLALITFFAPRRAPAAWWAALPRAQVAVMAVMLPLAAFWFQAGSWLALPANLVAIPWVSFVSVPLVLLGVALLPMPGLAAPVLELAWWSCAALHEFLQSLGGLEGGRRWLTPALSITATMLATAGGLLLLLPRGLAIRWLGAALLVMAMAPRLVFLPRGAYSVENLDVGQGLAVVVKTRNHSLLYDTGPGGSRESGASWSLFDSIIAPALAAEGRPPPQLLLVSHADLDHAGGLKDFQSRFPNIPVWLNAREDSGPRNGCHQGQAWTWDGVRFQVMHPSRYLPYLGNESSCVISIDNGRYRTLLTGDIGAVIEARLLAGLEPHDLVTVPHHGSNGSSSGAFIDALEPKWAIASAAYGNRFNFPRPEVEIRYRDRGAIPLSTIGCGAIRAVFPAPGQASAAPELTAARLDRKAPWRWAGEPHCMVTFDRAMYHSEGSRTEE